MNIQEIKSKWNYRERDVSASIEMWDSMANQFSVYELPTTQNSSLLKIIKEKLLINGESEALDVGCGTGKYSFALANNCKHVTGVDLSPKMIEEAMKNKKASSADNIDFYVIDWHAVELENWRLKNKFDLVIANMTPAVRNAETFMKLTEASKGFCIMSKPIKRTDPVSDSIREMLNIDEKKESADIEMMYPFEILWQQGMLPELFYEKQIWDMKKTLDDAYKLYANRMKSYRQLTHKEENEIYNYLKKISENNLVNEKVPTIIATMLWNVNN